MKKNNANYGKTVSAASNYKTHELNTEVLCLIKKAKQIIGSAKIDVEHLSRAELPEQFLEIAEKRLEDLIQAAMDFEHQEELNSRIALEWKKQFEKLNHAILDLLSSLVFYLEYKRIEWSGLENIIKNNGHLPDENILTQLVMLANDRKKDLHPEYFDFEKLAEAESLLEETRVMHRINLDHAVNYLLYKNKQDSAYRLLKQMLKSIQHYAQKVFEGMPEKLKNYCIE